ncbi:MAG: hypothetical protein LC795_09705 [Acidobacteria bacterium]|nr:hypothetical protein [Acidobacteriota bacterium]
MKRVLEVLGWLTAVALFAFAGHAVFAAAPAPGAPEPAAAQTTQRAGSQDDAGTSRERKAPARPREDLSPGSLVREARTVFVAESRHVEKKYLEYKLGKYAELRDWGLMLVADADKADLVLSVEKTALNYIFTLTDRRTSVIVATGKCVAVNGRLAAEYLGKEIIRKLKDVRASGDTRRRRDRDEEDDDEWSES